MLGAALLLCSMSYGLAVTPHGSAHYYHAHRVCDKRTGGKYCSSGKLKVKTEDGRHVAFWREAAKQRPLVYKSVSVNGGRASVPTAFVEAGSGSCEPRQAAPRPAGGLTRPESLHLTCLSSQPTLPRHAQTVALPPLQLKGLMLLRIFLATQGYIGSIDTAAQIKEALAATAHENELIVFSESRLGEAAQTMARFRNAGYSHILGGFVGWWVDGCGY